MKALLDTSVLIGREQGRPLEQLPDESAISAVTIAELHLGVMLAKEPAGRAERLRTLALVERTFDPLPIDAGVARRFAELVAGSNRARRAGSTLDALIAATAIQHALTLYTRDAGFKKLPGLDVVVV